MDAPAGRVELGDVLFREELGRRGRWGRAGVRGGGGGGGVGVGGLLGAAGEDEDEDEDGDGDGENRDSIAALRARASSRATLTKRTESPALSCPTFHSSASMIVAGQTKPPKLGPSGPRMIGMSPVKSIVPTAYALS